MGDPKAALLKELLRHLAQPELLSASFWANRYSTKKVTLVRWPRALLNEANDIIACPVSFYVGVSRWKCFPSVQSFSLEQLGNLSLFLRVLRAVRFIPCCLKGSTPMRLKKNLKLLLQLISFSITKTFHGFSQMSLIYEANKPSNNKNLLKSWYSSLLFLSVNVRHRKLMRSFWLQS